MATYDDDIVEDVTAEATWSSNNGAVIQGSWTANAGAAGLTITVTATIGGHQASKDIAVISGDLATKATEYIRRQLDQYHSQYFNVYTDVASGGDHFGHIAQIAGGVDPTKISVQDDLTSSPHSGRTCSRNAFLGRQSDWGGVYRMNGVLRSGETHPSDNWGTVPDAGLNLSGASVFEFWARGERGGERVEFFVGGIGRDAGTGFPIAPYPDSSPKRSTGWLTLSRTWQGYWIDLQGMDLSYSLGVGWSTNAPENAGLDVVFYLDDLRFDLPRPDQPRLAQSFASCATDTGPQTIYGNLATVYDNAIACIALIASGDSVHAKLIVDSLVYAAGHDRYYDDGRLRVAGMAGDLWTFPGWQANGRDATVRLPGWWGRVNDEAPAWYEDRVFVGTKTGDMAWAIIAILSYREAAGLDGNDGYLQAAVRLGEWIDTHCGSQAVGYTGGYDGWEPSPDALIWRSVEHNLDVYVAFKRLGEATRDNVWSTRAEKARQFVEGTMWNPAGFFWAGTTAEGDLQTEIIPLDVQAWAVMAFPEDDYSAALQWAEEHLRTQHNGYTGFAFSTADTSGVWFEGTAHMALAYRMTGDAAKADAYLFTLERAQTQHGEGGGLGIVAASKDGLQTGFEVTYDCRVHLGCSAWAALAGLGYNPYWGSR